jgi:uncharacterized protein
MMDVHFSKYLLIKENWPKEGYDLLFSTLTKAVVILEQKFTKSIKEGQIESVPKEMIGTLLDEGILTNLSDERQYAEYFFTKGKFNSRALGAMILTTYDCNFKCEYCVENDIKDRIEDMTDEVVRNVIQWFHRKINETKPEVIEIVYYGGEPLLNKRPIFDISRSLFDSALSRNLTFSFGIITNGSIGLSSHEMEELKIYGLNSIQVTIDGMPTIHNIRRPFKDGGGSFDIILSNLRQFVEFVPVILRINIDRGNANNIPALLDLLYKEGLSSKALLDFAPRIKSSNAPHLCDMNIMPDKTFIDTLNLLLPKARELGFSVSRRFVDSGQCTLQTDFLFIIDSIGDIYKCSGLVGRKEFSVGNVKDARLKSNFIEFEMMDRWKTCLDCPYVPLCRGGCLYKSLVTFGDPLKRVCEKGLLEEGGNGGSYKIVV